MATTGEIQGRLIEILHSLKEMPVATWLHEKREDVQDIAETVRLMAEVVYALSSEIDLYSRDEDADKDARREPSLPSPEEEEPADLESLPDDDDR